MNAEQFVQKLREDVVFFCEQLWVEMGWDKVAPLGWAEREMIEWIAGPRWNKDLPKKRITLAARGTGKTHIEIAVDLWLIFNDPDIRIQIVSKTGGADGESASTLGLISDCIKTVWFLEHLTPDESQKQKDNDLRMEVAGSSPGRNPTVRARGISGSITGTRANRFVGDDVEDKENTQTPAAKAKLRERTREADAIVSGFRKDEHSDPDEDVHLIGTYNTDPVESIYHLIPKETREEFQDPRQHYVVRSWPLVVPSPGDVVEGLAPGIVRRMESGELKPGDPIFPHRFGYEHRNVQAVKSRNPYALRQFGLVLNVTELIPCPLRLSDLIVFDMSDEQAPVHIAWGTTDHNGQSTSINEMNHRGHAGDCLRRPIKFSSEWAPYQRSVMAIDPSGTGKDKTGVAIVKTVGGFLYCPVAVGLKGPTGNGMDPEVRAEIVRLAKLHKVRDITVESNFAGDAFCQLLEADIRSVSLRPGQDPAFPNGWAATVIPQAKGAGRKEKRICETLTPVVRAHRLIVHRDVAENPDFQYQFTHITEVKDSIPHDDIVDALTDAVAMVSQNLAVDTSKAEDKEKERRWKAWAKERERRVKGMLKPQEPNWIVR